MTLDQSVRKLSLKGLKNHKKKKVKTTKKLFKSAIKWDKEEAYPYVEEIYKLSKDTIRVKKYIETTDPYFEQFLFKIIRTTTYPSFIKNNLKKIEKLLLKEIQHRDKVYEKMTKEQAVCYVEFFNDQEYFSRDTSDEYFEHQLERVFVFYLKAYCETGVYESKVRLENRIRLDILAKNGIENKW